VGAITRSACIASFRCMDGSRQNTKSRELLVPNYMQTVASEYFFFGDQAISALGGSARRHQY